MKSCFRWLPLVLAIIFSSCIQDPDPSCECSIPWISSPELMYEEGETVKHKGQCWTAFGLVQADLEEPGTIGIGIWEACESSEVLACDCPNEWAMMLEYPAGAIVFYQDACYIARLNNTGSAPLDGQGVWVLCE